MTENSAPPIPQDLQGTYRMAGEYICTHRGLVRGLIERIARLEQELSAAKAAHGETLLLLNKAAFETIPKLEQEAATIKHGPCCRDPWCEGECTCEICAPELAILELEIENEQWRTWGIVEIAVRNPNVAEYMSHWEERANKAEAQLARYRAPVSDEELVWLVKQYQPMEATNLSLALDALIEARKEQK